MTQVRKLIQSHQAEKPCNPWSADEKKATWNFQKMEINRKLWDESQRNWNGGKLPQQQVDLSSCSFVYQNEEKSWQLQKITQLAVPLKLCRVGAFRTANFAVCSILVPQNTKRKSMCSLSGTKVATWTTLTWLTFALMQMSKDAKMKLFEN